MISYRPEIDGLRALAVVPVILFHAGLKYFSGGFVGVDIFFVISGYLITSVIISELDSGNFTLLNFYERRARRILPALFFVVLVCIPYAWLILQPSELKDFAKSLIAVSTFSSNFLFYFESGYFDTTAELKPLLHTWSLAVEEQFYILFPLFMILVWKFGKKHIIPIFLFAFILSLCAAQWASKYAPNFAFFLLPTRAWELLIGSIIAVHVSNKGEYEGNNILSIIGFSMVIFSISNFNSFIPFPGIYALLPTLGAALIILFSKPGTIVYYVLSNKIIVFIGLLSYSAYLWHYPIFSLFRIYSGEDLDIYQSSLAISLTFLTSFLTWKYVELKFRHKNYKKSSARGVSLRIAFCTSGFLIILGFSGINVIDKNKIPALTDKVVSKGYEIDLIQSFYGDSKCVFRSQNVNSDFEEMFLKCSESYNKAIVVLGDSHGINIFNVVARMDNSRFVVGVTKPGCQPATVFGSCQYEFFDQFLSKYSSKIGLVLFHQSGSYLIQNEYGVFDSPLTFSDNAVYDFSEESIQVVIDYLNRLSKKTNVIWLGPFVEARTNMKNNSDFIETKINRNSIDVFRKLEEVIVGEINFRAMTNGFTYMSLHDILKIDSDFLVIDDCVTFHDADHFSSCGEKIVSDILKPRLQIIFEEILER